MAQAQLLAKGAYSQLGGANRVRARNSQVAIQCQRDARHTADGPTRDVYFINTEDPVTKEVMVYRNEDTGWSFPWYFKFDSADIQAKAQGYSRDANQLALIRYYGWRIKIFSVFPNITAIEATNSRDEPFPWFNTVFFSVLALLLIVIAIFIKRRVKRRPQMPVN